MVRVMGHMSSSGSSLSSSVTGALSVTGTTTGCLEPSAGVPRRRLGGAISDAPIGHRRGLSVESGGSTAGSRAGFVPCRFSNSVLNTGS